MPAMLARPSYPLGYYGQSDQVPLMPKPNWMSVKGANVTTSAPSETAAV